MLRVAKAAARALAPRLGQAASRASSLASVAHRSFFSAGAKTLEKGRKVAGTGEKMSRTSKRMMIVGGIAGALMAAATANEASAGEGPSKPGSQLSVYDVPLGKKMPDVVPCFIEVSRGSRNKYEWDNSMGFLKLDRVLHSAVFYPHNYGFLPQTLCGDGDPLDVLVMGDLPLVPGSLVDVRPIAYMVMEDEKGMDEKVLAVVAKDPHYVEMQTLRDVPEHVLMEIAHFFETYKALEKKKWVKVGGWKGTADTKKLIEETHDMYKLEKSKGPIEYAGN